MQDGQALQYAAESLRADREIVLEAVAQNGFALEYTSDEMKAGKQFGKLVLSLE